MGEAEFKANVMTLAVSEALLAELEHDPVVRTAHPRWLQKSLKAFWPEQWEAICAANNAHPPMILRVNRKTLFKIFDSIIYLPTIG